MMHYLGSPLRDQQAYADGYSDGFEAGRQYERDLAPGFWGRLSSWLLQR